ncbi:hypothetical protein XPR_0956 [Xanthomonas arboricola pv. pruni MAFF 301420]|uniref:Uncharacterized protein n=1 Tax=Xanthomonas arboricola pv. pruni MAFF 301420 TaxID=1418095 RepID=W4SCT2_9XANT|nr:hypothetical protein XPR_0956 [Xanthomonas arboricola pv. pruni MAFF 301420]
MACTAWFRLARWPITVMLSSVTGGAALVVASVAGGAAGALSCACALNAVASTQAMVVQRTSRTGVRRRRRLARWPVW